MSLIIEEDTIYLDYYATLNFVPIALFFYYDTWT